MEYIKKYWIGIMIAFGVAMFIKPALCSLILGSLVFYGGLMSILFQIKMGKKGIECIGRIISFRISRRGNKTPVIEYTPLLGTTFTEEPVIYASTDADRFTSVDGMINKDVIIKYDPDDPKKFIIADEKDINYVAFAFVTLVGLGFITVGIANLLGFIHVNYK